MNSRQRDGYKNRLKEGGVVYFVEGEDALGSPNSRASVKKGTVTDNSPRRRYPIINLWPAVDIDPHGVGDASAKSPRELFTPQEVVRVLQAHEGPLAIEDLAIDQIVADPVRNRELAIAMGERVIGRMADDLIRSPRNPEY